jgi:hypothetical protein
MPDDNSRHATVSPPTSTSAEIAPSLAQPRPTRKHHTITTHRDCKPIRQNTYELDKLCDVLNLTGEVKLEETDTVVHGGFADVRRGTWKGQPVAVKICRVHASKSSVETLKRVSHSPAAMRSWFTGEVMGLGLGPEQGLGSRNCRPLRYSAVLSGDYDFHAIICLCRH